MTMILPYWETYTRDNFLNEKRTIAYPGSTIQQNYGESCGKGIFILGYQGKG